MGKLATFGLKGRHGLTLRGQEIRLQTVENLDTAKPICLSTEGANVTIDTVDTPAPNKADRCNSFDFGWASGK